MAKCAITINAPPQTTDWHWHWHWHVVSVIVKGFHLTPRGLWGTIVLGKPVGGNQL